MQMSSSSKRRPRDERTRLQSASYATATQEQTTGIAAAGEVVLADEVLNGEDHMVETHIVASETPSSRRNRESRKMHMT